MIAEVALALPLLVASGLSTIGANRFLNGSQGYEPNGAAHHARGAAGREIRGAGRPRSVRRRVRDRAGRAARASVRSRMSNVMPSTDNNSTRPIEVDGRPNPDPANPPMADFRAVAPGFFPTMQIPVLQGRGFTTADTPDSQPVAIISQAAAERHFPGVDPIGRRVKLGTSPWLTVVGVSGDVIHDWFSRRNFPTVYRPYAQAPTGYLAIAVRADGDLASLVPAVRAAVRHVDPAQPIFDVMTLSEAVREKTIGLQYVAAIMAIFGLLALVLAVVGVYSLMAFIITQRTHEIGVRMALGANRRDVLRLTIGQAASMTAIGVALGLVLSLWPEQPAGSSARRRGVERRAGRGAVRRRPDGRGPGGRLPPGAPGHRDRSDPGPASRVDGGTMVPPGRIQSASEVSG